MRRSLTLSAAVGLAALFATSTAWADLVLLLPAEGRVPGKALTSTLAHETRYAIVEIGHNLVSDEEVEASVRQIADGRPDNADEFEVMARNTGAAWVVVPVIHSDTGAYRLEMTAYQASSGRTESVARDIDTNLIHDQVVEMAKVLISPKGVGTEALPWEGGGPPPPMSTGPDGQTPASNGEPEASGSATSTGLQPLVGVTLGVASAISRPDNATGTSTSVQGGIRAGLQLDNPLEFALDLRGNISGPKATTVDVSARYWIAVSEGIRLAPEIAPGLFIMGGGAQDKSFMMRLTAVGAVDVTSGVSVEAHVGDVTWVPASGGTVVLGGGTLAGVARF
jgi:hypothetical protein